MNPVNGERIPVFVAPYVLMEYGTGAVMGVPAHDQRDFEFAASTDLPIRVVVQPEGEQRDPATMTEAYDHEGVMVNSGPFDGVRSPGVDREVIAWLERAGDGRRGGHVPAARLADQPAAVLGRADPDHPLPDARRGRRCRRTSCRSLLPDDVDFRPGGESPLARHEAFVNTTCPVVRRAGRARHRHDGHVRRLLLVLLPVLLPARRASGRSIREAVARWMPVDQYIGGVEHAILHLLYCRFFTKVLFDLGLVAFTEPMPRLMNQGQVIYDGASM